MFAKYLFIFFLAFTFSMPVFAQEAVTVSATRLELAGKMHEIWPIRTRIETAIEAVSESFPEEKRLEIKSAMRKAIQFDQVEEASIRAMAETFTEEELKAMIDFYGSEAGRSVSAKTADYEAALRPVLGQMLDKAMLDIRTGQTTP
jgi:hypothetical protein